MSGHSVKSTHGIKTWAFAICRWFPQVLERRVGGFVDVEMPLEDVEMLSRRDAYAAVSIRRTWTHPLPEWSWFWPRWKEHRPKWTWADFHSEYLE